MKTKLTMSKTFQPTAKEVKRNWHLIDVKGLVLGRVATNVAMHLMGKTKADYSPHMDNGDNVVIVNAGLLRVTGKKEDQKVYYGHSGYPGGFKQVSYKQMKETHPERILSLAVKGMLPPNRLTDTRMKRLHISMGSKNPYESKFIAK